MRNILTSIAIGLLSVSLMACATYAGPDHRWSGNPKFSVGLNAPSVVGVDAAARATSEPKPR